MTYEPPYIGKQTVVPDDNAGIPCGYQVNTYGPNGWLIRKHVPAHNIPAVKREQLEQLHKIQDQKNG